MPDANEVAAAFGAKSHDEKREDFEASTVSLILTQLGAPKGAVRGWRHDLGPAFDTDWFNGNGWITPNVYVDRCFNFNFTQLLTAPAKHPITKMFEERLAGSDVDAVFVVFKVYDVGRMIATNVKPNDMTYIHVHARHPFNVVSFRNFFRNKYGTIIER